MRKFLITEVERYNVLKDVVEQRLKLKDASELLGISYRQAIRLKKKFIQQGIEGLIRKSPHSPPNLKITQQLKDKIIELRISLYLDFNILHFKDKLSELHDISLSHESLRKLLIDAGLHEPRKKKRIYRRRRRMPNAGDPPDGFIPAQVDTLHKR